MIQQGRRFRKDRVVDCSVIDLLKKLRSLYLDVVHSMFSIKDRHIKQPDSGNSVILNLTYYVYVATTGFKTLFVSIPGNLEVDLGPDSSLESSQSISSNITSK